jgi:hypothetical protein
VSLPSKLRSVISTSTSSPPPSKKHTHTNYTFAFRLASPVSRPPCLPLRSSTARSGPFTKVAASRYAHLASRLSLDGNCDGTVLELTLSVFSRSIL